MQRRNCYRTLVLLILAAGCKPSGPVITYSVDSYDPKRNPAMDLAVSVSQAKSSGKRILLQVGGDWCAWCHQLERFLETEPAVAEALGENFIVMKVNSSDENRNEAFLSQFPAIAAYPHWIVLDEEGKFLHSQNMADLEAGETYSRPAILRFVDQWKAAAGGA